MQLRENVSYTVPVSMKYEVMSPRQERVVNMHVATYTTALYEALEPFALENLCVSTVLDVGSVGNTLCAVTITAETSDDIRTDVRQALDIAMLDAANALAAEDTDARLGGGES